jgi:subfamily B ATP-binding cassette protein MsbA
MRKLIFNRYLSSGKLFFDRSNQGYLSSVLIDSTNIIAYNLSFLKGSLMWLPMLFVYLILMVLISWKLTVFTLIFVPVLYCSIGPVIERIKSASKNYADSREKLSIKAFNTLSCIPLVKSYTYEVEEEKDFARLSDRVEKLEFSLDKKQGLIAPLQEIVVVVAVLCLVLFVSFWVVGDEEAGVSKFLVFLFLLKRSSNSFGSLNSIKAVLASINGQIMEVHKILDDGDKYPVVGGVREFKGLREGIEFNHIVFSYVEGVPVLKGVAFSVGKGEVTAIVGSTGGGKTTLINLLMRFYDCPPSSIMIDGVDIREFTLESLMARMALVSQDTLLFNDTIRNNIKYGLNREVTDEGLAEVVRQARLYDFIMRLPGGFNTYIGDKGVKLSGGEKQRLSIARALLKNAEILILDEATSSLDSKTEKLIQEAIDEVIKDKTAIVIAHRLSTIKNADRIVVIEDGGVVEEGSLKELLGRRGIFRQYWEEQKFY